MKTCYIAIGGIGGGIVAKHKERYGKEDSKYLYFDSDPHDIYARQKFFDKVHHFTPPGDYLFKGEKHNYASTGIFREIGKDLFKYSLYADIIPEIIDDFFVGDIRLVFVTTTFGGFGSGIAYELIEYLNAQIRKRKNYGRLINHLVALPPENYKTIFGNMPTLTDVFEMNTFNFVNEYRYYEFRKSMFFPEIKLFVPKLSMERENYCEVLDYSENELAKFDIKERYKKITTKKKADVFISYSSKDKTIADMLDSKLKEKGITTWIDRENIKAGSYPTQIVEGIRNAQIFVVLVSSWSINSQNVLSEIDQAFNRLKDGIKIMPFMLSRVIMSDECSYYLSRQEMFFGDDPPIEIKIEEFVEKIKRELE